jgi:small subunit ribosomal protein S2
LETQETGNEPVKEKPTIDETEAIPRAENLLLPLEELLAAGLHIGTRIKTVDMERYIFRVRPDGLFILNIGDTNEKIRISARFMARFDPARVLSVSSRLYGKTPVEKFAEVTKTSQVTGRFMPGLISNPLQPRHAEPQIVLVTDPRADYQAIKEASSVGIPVIALCDTDNVFAGVDLVIPVNNKGRRALAVVYWLLARQVLRERGELPQDGTIPQTVDDFETKLAAMPMARASGGEP